MKIYTRGGDRGETGLPGGIRLSKDADRLEACGTVDELSSLLGQVRAAGLPEAIERLLERAQQELIYVGTELASPDTQRIGPDRVEALEAEIDGFDETLPPLRDFILPGGTPAAAALHVARAVCRRAERRLVTLAQAENVSPNMLAYFNRLGDLLFVLARVANAG